MNNYPSRQKVYRSKYDRLYTQEHADIRNARARAWNKANPEIVKNRARERLRKFKSMVFEHYGQQCVCCGVTEEAFLTIDHINKNGKEHREEVGQGTAFYRWIVKFNYPVDLRILCMNCNYGQRRRPECPHQVDKLANKG